MQECATRELQVPAAKRELIEAIGLLGEKIKTLETRLDTALLPSAPKPTGPATLNGKISQVRVELAEFLNTQTNEVRHLVSYVQDLIERCEL